MIELTFVSAQSTLEISFNSVNDVFHGCWWVHFLLLVARANILAEFWSKERRLLENAIDFYVQSRRVREQCVQETIAQLFYGQRINFLLQAVVIHHRCSLTTVLDRSRTSTCCYTYSVWHEQNSCNDMCAPLVWGLLRAIALCADNTTVRWHGDNCFVHCKWYLVRS